jgi:hypothetical protein
MPDSPTFRHLKKGYALHVHTAGSRKGNTLDVLTAGSEKGHTMHVHRQLLMVLLLLHDMGRRYVNAGM